MKHPYYNPLNPAIASLGDALNRLEPMVAAGGKVNHTQLAEAIGFVVAARGLLERLTDSSDVITELLLREAIAQIEAKRRLYPSRFKPLNVVQGTDVDVLAAEMTKSIKQAIAAIYQERQSHV